MSKRRVGLLLNLLSVADTGDEQMVDEPPVAASCKFL